MDHSNKGVRTIGSTLAAVSGAALCLPLLLVYITAAYGLISEPPLTQLLTSDGSRPSVLGFALMFIMLLCLPAGFVINLLPMVTKAETEQFTSFKPSPAHNTIGLAGLFSVLILLRQGVLHELRPFVNWLGPATFLGQILFFLVLLVLPVAFLLNRVPRRSMAGFGVVIIFKPNSINLIVGAAILLMIIMVVSMMLLETTACLVGVPNCD